MEPTLMPGQIIVGMSNVLVHIGDIVILLRNDTEIIKRVTQIKKYNVWVEGDNPALSTDSRDFGWISKKDILGIMKYKLPIATDPPKLRVKRGPLLGWIAAVIMIGFALVHLFRIDTFIPELAMVFDNNQDLAQVFAAGIVTMEVFALPFLMRMRLSPLAHYVSGALAVIVPLKWLLISVWMYGADYSTAQLGEFVALPSNWLLVGANFVWLVFSYYTIWALGYDHRPNEKQSVLSKWLTRLSK